MWSCTCKLLLNTGIWIIYLATIQLGTSLVFTFYHQGHWVSPHSNLTHDTSSVLVHSQKQNLSVEWIYINTLRKQKVDEHAKNQARQPLDSTVVQNSRSEAKGDVKGSVDTHRDSLHTMAPMFTADNLVSFQQLWGKLNLRKCPFSCPLDQTITLSPQVYKNICLQRTVHKMNINWLAGFVRSK